MVLSRYLEHGTWKVLKIKQHETSDAGDDDKNDYCQIRGIIPQSVHSTAKRRCTHSHCSDVRYGSVYSRSFLTKQTISEFLRAGATLLSFTWSYLAWTCKFQPTYHGPDVSCTSAPNILHLLIHATCNMVASCFPKFQNPRPIIKLYLRLFGSQ